MTVYLAHIRLLLAATFIVEGAAELPSRCAASVGGCPAPVAEDESVSLLQIHARPLRVAAGADSPSVDGAIFDSLAVKAARAEIEKITSLRRGFGQGQAYDHQHGELAFFSGGARYMELHKDDYPPPSEGHVEPQEAQADDPPVSNHMEMLFQERASLEDERSSQRPSPRKVGVLVQEATVVDANDSKTSSDMPAAKLANVSGRSLSILAPLLDFLSGSSPNESGEATNASTLVSINMTLSAPAEEKNESGEATNGSVLASTNVTLPAPAKEEDPEDTHLEAEESQEPYCQALDDPEEGFDREGGDMMARPVNGSVASCLEKCCNTAGCLAYVYAKAPSNYGSCEEGEMCCYLKSEVTEKKQSEYEAVATGLVRRQGPRATLSQDWKNASSHSLTDVVGEGGVLKIALPIRPEWENREEGHIATEGEEDDYQKRSLRQAEITPTIFNATDAETSSEEELKQGCRLESDPDTEGFCRENKKDGSGCKSRVESAIADSHRRALLAALKRTESDWTLIMEDDVVPVNPAEWNHAFQDAWPKLPSQYKMIRLGWCTFEEDLGLIRKTSAVNGTGSFQLNNWMSWNDMEGNDHYYSGGCTTAYMVHKEIIPEILGIFPCCCALDCCLEGGLYYQPTTEPDLFRGQQVVTNMDTNNTEEYSHLFTFFNQSGVLVQDNRQMRSTRPEYNQTGFLEVRNHSEHGRTKPTSQK